MALFNAMSPLNGGDMQTYYRDWEYPYDLNAGLDYVRLPGEAQAFFPFPETIGVINGLAPLLDSFEKSIMLGQTPGSTPVDMLNNQLISNLAFPEISGAMVKITG